MTKYNPQIHHRRSIRLKGYDSSQAGLYFITICVQHLENRFGKIAGDKPEMILNDAGKMVECEWLKLPDRFPNIELHEYIVMPNHFHGILEIVGATLSGATLSGANLVVAQKDTGQPQEPGQPQGIAPTKTVGDMMDAFKSITTVEYIRGVKTGAGHDLMANYGNEIIGNTLFAMKAPITTFQNTSQIIRQSGQQINCIRISTRRAASTKIFLPFIVNVL